MITLYEWGWCHWRDAEATREWLDRFETHRDDGFEVRLAALADLRYSTDNDWVFVGYREDDRYISHKFLIDEFERLFVVDKPALDSHLTRHLGDLSTSDILAALEQLGGYTQRLYSQVVESGSLEDVLELLAAIADMEARQRAFTMRRFHSRLSWNLGDVNYQRGPDGEHKISHADWEFRYQVHRAGTNIKIYHRGTAVVDSVAHYVTANADLWQQAIDKLRELHAHCQAAFKVAQDNHRQEKLDLLASRLIQEHIVSLDDFNTVIAGNNPGLSTQE